MLSWSYRKDGKCEVHIKEAVQAIQELDFVEDSCNINQYIKKRMQNNDISEIINMERQDISQAVYYTCFEIFSSHLLQKKEAFPFWKNCWPRTEILRLRMRDITDYMILHYNASTWWLLACRVNYVLRLDLFCHSNSLLQQISLRNCVCFRLLNICFIIKF